MRACENFTQLCKAHVQDDLHEQHLEPHGAVRKSCFNVEPQLNASFTLSHLVAQKCPAFPAHLLRIERGRGAAHAVPRFTAE